MQENSTVQTDSPPIPLLPPQAHLNLRKIIQRPKKDLVVDALVIRKMAVTCISKLTITTVP
jgi:hypothetical protein